MNLSRMTGLYRQYHITESNTIMYQCIVGLYISIRVKT